MSTDLNYKDVNSLVLNGSIITDDHNGTGNMLLPAPLTSQDLRSNNNLVVDGVKPDVVIVLTGTNPKSISATDDDSGTTIMKRLIQTEDSCADTIPETAVDYTEGDVVSLDQESYDGKYVCFWSTDHVGNVGSAVSVEITGLKIRIPLTVYSPNTDGYYGIGSDITISVNFSEVVTVTGSPYIILDTGMIDMERDLH